MTKHKTGTREEWLAERLQLLKAEKELMRRSDELARRRQELPWVRIGKDYRFESEEGEPRVPPSVVAPARRVRQAVIPKRRTRECFGTFGDTDRRSTMTSKIRFGFIASLFIGAGTLCSGPLMAQEQTSAAQESDRKEIVAILEAWEDAWNRHDMSAFGKLFHEDGVWVLWTGQVWTGRKAIEDGHAEVHRTVFRKSTQRERLEELTLVGRDAAVVRFCSTLTGDERSPGKLVRSRKILIVTRRADGWKVGWGQNTRFADSAPDAPACASLK